MADAFFDTSCFSCTNLNRPINNMAGSSEYSILISFFHLHRRLLKSILSGHPHDAPRLLFSELNHLREACIGTLDGVLESAENVLASVLTFSSRGWETLKI
jgi:hypothetical protein